MAFAKGRGFVILNSMAEDGNPDAQRLLKNLKSMPQDEFDAEFTQLLGSSKGGGSAKGSPKGDAKKGDAPEKAAKGEKTPKEQAAPKEMKSAKEGIKPVENYPTNPMKFEAEYPKEFAARVQALEEEGMDNGDAQGVAMAEVMTGEFSGFFKNKAAAQPKATGVAPEQKTDAFGTSKEMGGGIGGGQKDLLGKKSALADPNRPDIQAEMEQEMEDQLSGTGTDFEDEEGLALAFETVKKRYANDPQRLAALEKLEAKNPNLSPQATKPAATPQQSDDAEFNANQEIINQRDTNDKAKQELFKQSDNLVDSYKKQGQSVTEAVNSAYEEALAMAGGEDSDLLKTIRGQYGDLLRNKTLRPQDNLRDEIANEEAAKQEKARYNAAVASTKYDLVKKGEKFLKPNKSRVAPGIPASELEGVPEFTFEEAYGESEATPNQEFTEGFNAENNQFFILKDKDGNRYFVNNEGYDYARFHAPIDDKAAKPAATQKSTKDAYDQPEVTDPSTVSDIRDELRTEFDNRVNEIAEADADMDLDDARQAAEDEIASGEYKGWSGVREKVKQLHGKDIGGAEKPTDIKFQANTPNKPISPQVSKEQQTDKFYDDTSGNNWDGIEEAAKQKIIKDFSSSTETDFNNFITSYLDGVDENDPAFNDYDSVIAEYLDKNNMREMNSKKSKLSFGDEEQATPTGSAAEQGTDIYDFARENSNNQTISTYVSEFETYANDGEFTLPKFQEYLEMMSQDQDAPKSQRDDYAEKAALVAAELEFKQSKTVPVDEVRFAVNYLIGNNPDIKQELNTILSFMRDSAKNRSIETANEWFLKNGGEFIDRYSGDPEDKQKMRRAIEELKKELQIK